MEKLFKKDNYKYTDTGISLTNDIEKALDPVIDKYLAKGCIMKDIHYVILTSSCVKRMLGL